MSGGRPPMRTRCVLARGPEVGEDRHLLADLGEVVDRQLHVGRVGHRQKVQYRIGRSTQGDDDRDRVLKGLAGEDVARPDAGLQEGDGRLAGAPAVDLLLRTDGQLRRAVRKTHAQGLDRRCHGVGGVHAAAGPGARDGATLDLGEARVIQGARGVLAHRLEHRDDVALGLGLRVDARKDGAAVDEDRRPVQARQRHHAAGHVLVTAADGHDRVEGLGVGDRLNGVGDHFPGHKRVAHALGAHADPVGDGDRAEDDGLTAGPVRAAGRLAGELVNVHVAGRHHAPGRRDAHDRLLEILVAETDGPQHGPVRCAVGTVEHDGGELAGGVGRDAHRLGNRFDCTKPSGFPQAAFS